MMEINHRVSLCWDKIKKRQLADFGVEVNEGFDAFEISESSAAWPHVRQLITAWDPVDVVITQFSRSELRSAAYLKIGVDGHHGYPQPEEGFGYLEATYEDRDYCSSCGIGTQQNAAFRMKGEPRWRNRHVMQLNWVFDVFFAQPQIWAAVFSPLGIGCSEVIDHASSKPLESVVQLKVDSAVTLHEDVHYPSESCSACGRRKLLPITRGAFPAVDGMRGLHLAKTREFFGSGASAWNAVIVSARVYHEIDKANVKGLRFTPLEGN